MKVIYIPMNNVPSSFGITMKRAEELTALCNKAVKIACSRQTPVTHADILKNIFHEVFDNDYNNEQEIVFIGIIIGRKMERLIEYAKEEGEELE